MSLEAQFYEAQRRQHIIERHQFHRAQKEIDKQTQQPEYQTIYIPIRVYRQDDKHEHCTCIPMRRIKIAHNDRSLYERDRDIYPRPTPITSTTRRTIRRAKIPNRLSSIDYLQQW